MKYFIDNVEKSEKELELNKQIDNYTSYSQYWPPKDKIRDILKEKREFSFPIHDKRFTKQLNLMGRICFITGEEEILDMASIITENDNNAYDNNSLQIAVTVYIKQDTESEKDRITW